MIVVPVDRVLQGDRAYRDSFDPAAIYVDASQPRLCGSEAVRWLPIPTQQAYLMCEVQFGASPAVLQQAQVEHLGCRALSMPWPPSPVYVWSKPVGGVRLLAIGKTSGYGRHNAILNATTAIDAVTAPIAIAAELITQALLSPAIRSIRAGGDAEAVRSIAFEAADWSATVAAVLIDRLRQLVAQGNLSIAIESAADAAELHDLVLMEWAHRLSQAAGIESLACPAAVRSISGLQVPDLQINWRGGETMPLRVVRTLCPESIVSGY